MARPSRRRVSELSSGRVSDGTAIKKGIRAVARASSTVVVPLGSRRVIQHCSFLQGGSTEPDYSSQMQSKNGH